MNTSGEALILRVNNGRVEETLDDVATEKTFGLVVNEDFLVSLLCTPTELDAMAVGFLLSEGFLADRETLRSVRVDEEGASVHVSLTDLPSNWESRFERQTISSGCGRGVTFSRSASAERNLARVKTIETSPGAIEQLLRKFRDGSELYRRTGGVHSAALSDGSELILFSEDIGRHNAVDKLIGKSFLRGIPVGDKILLSSGRISGEIMTKVVRAGIPILVSRAAPTCMSIASAEDHGVTLIGFARGSRMNIYTHPWRVVV